MGAMDSGRSGNYQTGLVIEVDGVLKLEYRYWYESPCNCHPETCCCSGMDTIRAKHELLIINPDEAILGEYMKYTISNTKVTVY